MLENILEKIKEFDTIIIHRHKRADGDAVGSQMGLKTYLKDNFPNKNIYAVGDAVPDYLEQFSSLDNISDEIYDNALVFVVDTSNSERIADDRWQKGKYIIKIDHHDDSPDFGNFCYVEPKTPSCASVITSIIKTWSEYTISPQAAYSFLLGIVTDTGRFRYRGMNEEVFDNASKLVSTGADLIGLYDKLYVDELNVLKLQGYILNHFKTTPNGVAYIYFTEKMMKRFKVNKVDAANLINAISSIRGCLIWIAFIDQMLPKDKTIKNKLEAPQNEIRVRLRSRGVAVNDIAGNYRGGGHLQAAGATIYSKKEMKSILKELDEKLGKYKNEHPEAI